MTSYNSYDYDYDIAVDNADGVTIYYNFINEGTELEVTGKRKDNVIWMVYTGSVNIPEEVTYMNKTYKVTSIGEQAFHNSQLNSVTIPQSVTNIGEHAFWWCDGLTSIIIPNKVVSIGNGAFSGCSGLTSFIIPSYVTTIGSAAFMGCNRLTSITIPNGVSSINSQTFQDCSSLASVVIPNSVISIGSRAFSGTAITTVDIPNSVISIGSDAFNNTPWFNNQPDGLVYINKFAYKYKGEMPSNTEITVIEGTTVICGHAFGNCGNLTSITMPNSLTTIGPAAFLGCTGLSSIDIPNSVTSIEGFAFYECSNLNSITIPNDVTSIFSWTFYGCTNLSSVTISNNVTTIDTNAFYKCAKLASIIIPNSVTTIGYQAFRDCEGLTSITIGSGVTNIGGFAFADCPELTDVYCYSQKLSNVSVDELDTFSEADGLYTDFYAFKGSYIGYATLHVPKGCLAAYKAKAPWKNFKSIVEMVDAKVKLSKTKATIEKGKTLTLKATLTPSDLTDKSVTWESSNTKVATVTSVGKVKGVKAGTATITCTSKATGAKATCKVTVGYVKLDQTEATILKGKTVTLAATVYPSSLTDKNVTWESSNTKIATVTTSGKVKGVKAGTATITCTSNATGLKATCTVNVVKGFVTLNKTEAYVQKGKTTTLKATVTPETLEDKSVTWESSDKSIVTVTSAGKVKGIKYGTATITCTSVATGAKATCQITVGKVIIGTSEVTIKKSRTVTLSATVYPSALEDKSVTWKSSNTAVATVSSDGIVTGVKAGTATITCTSVATGLKGTCTVTVLSVAEARSVFGEDDGTTAIENLDESPAAVEPYDVYDLSGRKVLHQVTSLDGLPNGIYIVNGRKVLKKD